MDYNRSKGGADNLDLRDQSDLDVSQEPQEKSVPGTARKGTCCSTHERRKKVPRTKASAQIVKAFQSAGLTDLLDDQASTSTFKASKRKRCLFYPKEKDNKNITIIHVLNAINTYAKAVPYHTVHHVLNR
ncbi:unnamed protein product [Lepeophtheirus salmonis]|uniref:(salmon louse) hypothetical protein n=1 Tax=Lepeophtheirus salmonis TaxID=72036 RepID=A0A7R8H0W2_LEPSM|nr:unnamed protein product [Lepeophtheirus salmonis]CAF2797081.1 unnamed protein product [Lepeophtheirus salmonis]